MEAVAAGCAMIASADGDISAEENQKINQMPQKH